MYIVAQQGDACLLFEGSLTASTDPWPMRGGQRVYAALGPVTSMKYMYVLIWV